MHLTTHGFTVDVGNDAANLGHPHGPQGRRIRLDELDQPHVQVRCGPRRCDAAARGLSRIVDDQRNEMCDVRG